MNDNLRSTYPIGLVGRLKLLVRRLRYCAADNSTERETVALT